MGGPVPTGTAFRGTRAHIEILSGTIRQRVFVVLSSRFFLTCAGRRRPVLRPEGPMHTSFLFGADRVTLCPEGVR